VIEASPQTLIGNGYSNHLRLLLSERAGRLMASEEREQLRRRKENLKVREGDSRWAVWKRIAYIWIEIPRNDAKFSFLVENFIFH
jgi:hypothetical protein